MPGRILELTYSLSDIHKTARLFWEEANKYHVLAFSGMPGAGKTTFIHALCDHLGVEDPVSSPTYALIQEYHFQEQIIYHMDWYRLHDEEEAINAGIEDCLAQPGAWCFIEWPEQAAALLRSPYLWITLKNKGMEERRITAEVR